MIINYWKEILLFGINFVFFLGSFFLFINGETTTFASDLPIYHEKFASFGTFVSIFFAATAAVIAYLAYFENKRYTEIQHVHALQASLSSQIDSMQYREKCLHSSILYSGIDAIYNFTEKHWNNRNSIMDSVNACIISFKEAIYHIEKNKYFKKDQRIELLNRTYMTLYAKLLWPVKSSIYDKLGDELYLRHDDSKFILPKFEILFNETIKYLGKVNLIAPHCDMGTAHLPNCTKKHLLYKFTNLVKESQNVA